MAEAAVEFLVEKLKELLLQHAHLTPGAVNQAERLEKTLGLFKYFEFPKYLEMSKGRELIRRIRRILYDAEEIIGTCVNQANADNILFHVDGSKIVGVVDQVEAVVKKFLNYHKHAPVKVQHMRQDETKRDLFHKRVASTWRKLQRNIWRSLSPGNWLNWRNLSLTAKSKPVVFMT